jgi:type II secretory pathway pseudopilin PulG
MRIHIPCKSSNAGRRRSGPLRMLADSQAGFSIIEVVVSALMLTLMAGAVATALATSGAARRRTRSPSRTRSA